MQLQKWQSEFSGLSTRVVAITTDSVAKNERIAQRIHITFPILSDPDGSTLMDLGMWDDRWKIASYGYYLLDENLNVVNHRRGSWKPTDRVKAFFMKTIADAMVKSATGG